jgi:hypothetical protein
MDASFIWRPAVKNSRRFSHLFLPIVGLVMNSSSICAEPVRAHYQLNVQEGADLKRVAMSSDLTSGVPIKYDLGKYSLLLLIDVGESEAYVLTVSLAPLTSPNEVMLKRSFNGKFVGANQGPLEFETEHNGVKLFGAIAVSRLPLNLPTDR